MQSQKFHVYHMRNAYVPYVSMPQCDVVLNVRLICFHRCLHELSFGGVPCGISCPNLIQGCLFLSPW